MKNPFESPPQKKVTRKNKSWLY